MSSLYLPNEAIRTRAELKKAAQPSLASYVRRIDWLLFAAVLGLALLSLDTIATGTRDDLAGNPTYYLDAQRLNFIVGAAGMLIGTFISPNLYRRLAWPLMGVTVALLCMVLVAGEEVRGARRWVQIGSFNFQPSDVGKLVLVIGIAALLANHREQIGRWWLTPLALLYAGGAAALVYIEPDFGTSLVFFAATLGVLWVAGTPWTHFAALACIVGASAFLVLSVLPASGVQVVKGYQMDRLTSFLHPEKNLDTTGWNQYQAKIAVGAGGLDGRPPRHATTPTGRPAQDFLPEHHTDFVFASMAEQRGFVGAVLLLGLYLVLLWRILRAITVSGTLFGSLVCAGIATWFLFSIFINIGMTVGLAPVTGIPLPFMSYGGSAILVALYAVGIVQAVQLRGRMPERDAERSLAAGP
jgi:rod shape determining protein RodA